MEFAECAALLRENDNYILLTHRRPDGDTLGSAAALCHALRRLGKTAQLYHNPDITDTYRRFTENYLGPAGVSDGTVISVDVADTGMLSRGFERPVWMKIDHHIPRNTMAPYELIHAEKASCGEIVLTLIKELCGNIDREEANLLYIAVSTDTGCFCYANTKGDTLRAAAELADAGAETARLNKLLFRTKSLARLSLEGMVYSSLQSYRGNELNLAVITLEMLQKAGATEDDLDDLANLAGQVKNSRVSATIRELRADPPRCKVSLRTDGVVDASAVCAVFGGGGHKMASGCEMDLAPAETAQKIREAVEAAWV